MRVNTLSGLNASTLMLYEFTGESYVISARLSFTNLSSR